MLSLLLPALLSLAAPAAAGDEAPTTTTEAPASTSRVLLAGQLAVTAEPGEDGGPTVGINVLPVVLEWAATDHVGLRLSSTLNLQVAGPATGLAHRGGAVTVPVYLSGQHKRPHQGVYVGPMAGFTLNPLVDGSDLTLGAEGGARWLLGERVGLNLAAQLGASRLDRPTEDRWVNHFGFYPSIGVWL